MGFFIDHCAPEAISLMLEGEKYKVERLRKHLTTDAPDEEVIEIAQKLNAILVSLNGDFSNILQYPPSEYCGIIALQVRNRPEAVKIITKR